MKKAFLAFILLFSATFTGCLEFHQIITIRPDGAATVSMTYAVPEKHLPAMAAAMEALTPNASQSTDAVAINWFMDEKAVRNFFDKPKDGIRIIAYKQFKRDDRQCAEIIIEAKKAEQAFASGIFGPMKLNDSAFTVSFPKSLDELPRTEKERLRKLCCGLSMEIELFTPEDITDTSGYLRGKRHAVWHFSANGRGIDIFGKLFDISATWMER